ncbi:MAG: CBS domain-containing protein [Myxococcota bacterium]
MRAAEVMTRQLVTVKPKDTVAEAIGRLYDNDIRHLPVVDHGRLVGMLSDRDLRPIPIATLEQLEGQTDPEQALDRRRVADIMSGDLVSVDPDTDIDEIITIMIEQKVGAVPVVDLHTDKLIGIVSYVDVLRAAIGKL